MDLIGAFSVKQQNRRAGLAIDSSTGCAYVSHASKLLGA
jgi:hypothetical protein